MQVSEGGVDGTYKYMRLSCESQEGFSLLFVLSSSSSLHEAASYFVSLRMTHSHHWVHPQKGSIEQTAPLPLKTGTNVLSQAGLASTFFLSASGMSLRGHINYTLLSLDTHNIVDVILSTSLHGKRKKRPHPKQLRGVARPCVQVQEHFQERCHSPPPPYSTKPTWKNKEIAQSRSVHKLRLSCKPPSRCVLIKAVSV